MKKTKLLLLLLCVIPAAKVGDPSVAVGVPAAGTTHLILEDTLDFSDLDVRDAKNQRVLSAAATQELATLFRENLVNLRVFASPHSASEARHWIESISYLYNKSIFMRLTEEFRLILEAIFYPNRRFVHNVDNLWATFYVGLFTGCLLILSLNFVRVPRRVYLRC